MLNGSFDFSDSLHIGAIKPMIALTFDDGPGEYTDRLLDIFAKNGGKGTFFIVGEVISSGERTLKRIADEGHEIGNHSWGHLQLTYLTEEEITQQIVLTKNKIREIAGVNTSIVRPPYGSCDDKVKSVGRELCISFINWSVDTMDWKTKNADAVYNEIINNAKNGDIVLCHDVHKTTVDAMERVIPKLIEMGFQLVTVSSLLAYSETPMSAGELYFRQ